MSTQTIFETLVIKLEFIDLLYYENMQLGYNYDFCACYRDACMSTFLISDSFSSIFHWVQ